MSKVLDLLRHEEFVLAHVTLGQCLYALKQMGEDGGAWEDRIPMLPWRRIPMLPWPVRFVEKDPNGEEDELEEVFKYRPVGPLPARIRQKALTEVRAKQHSQTEEDDSEEGAPKKKRRRAQGW